MVEFNQKNISEIETNSRIISCFELETSNNANIDLSVVESFGDEWLKFHGFDENDIVKLSETYFDIVDDTILNKNTYAMDAGCGSGRFSKYIAQKVNFVEAIDPSNAVLAADKVLANNKNVRISKASISNIPFNDETFDFVMSIGVLHHIPNTKDAMMDCVKKVKIGGYFFTYLYYNLDNRGLVFKFLFFLATFLRSIVCKLPQAIKKFVCDVISIVIYMPIVLLGRFFNIIGLKKIANALPLSYYQTQSFLVIRNDALDRFGTSLEQRFTKEEILIMMKECGLDNIIVSNKLPLWHAVGKRVK